jgi:hypothetical protein
MREVAGSKKKVLEMAVRDLLRRPDADFCPDGVFENVPRWEKFVSVLSCRVGKYKYLSAKENYFRCCKSFSFIRK